MAVQQELNEQLGGIFSGLSQELLLPYLHRKLHLLARSKKVLYPAQRFSLAYCCCWYWQRRSRPRQQALMEFGERWHKLWV